MSTDKTLADVQPGGRVRLGDQALSTSEGARRYVADYFATQLSRHDFGDYILTELAADFACALAQHLSAQPSPGGQDAPERCAECRHTTFEVHPDGHICVHCKLIVSARQPVGQEPVYGHSYREGFSEGKALGICQRYRDVDAIVFNAMKSIADIAMLHDPLMAEKHIGFLDGWFYSARHEPPAQAVDLGAVRDIARKAYSVALPGSEVDAEIRKLLALIDSQDSRNG